MRQIFQSLKLQYKGQPTIGVFCDGESHLNDIQLPNHSNYKTRNVQLPPLVYGDNIQFTTTHQGAIKQEFNSVPEEQFIQMQLYQSFEIKFSGTVKVAAFIDGISQTLNGGTETQLILSPRSNKTEDTRRIYFPPLSFGYVPQLQQIFTSTETGQVLYATPRALPARYFKGLREHGQIQVTYQGDINVSVFLDGTLLESYPLTSASDPNSYHTIQEYLPAGSRGNVLQWIQTDTDLTTSGEIAIFETDTTLSDIDQPQQEV